MTCHFAYAVPAQGIRRRVRRKLYPRLQPFGLPLCWFGHRRNPDTSQWPRCSPYENTRNIYAGLSAHVPTLLYDFREHVGCQCSPEDVFLGHPYFPAKPGAKGVTELSLVGRPRPRVFALISPLHCNISVRTSHINKAFLDAVDGLLPEADLLFGIMGQYWWDLWKNSPYAHWMPKMIRLDMAIAAAYFPRVKMSYNAPGKRGFLYIGRNDAMKGTEFLGRLAAALPDFRFGWIGPGEEIKGVVRISPPRLLTPDFMAEAAKNFDFFISPSVADPNPTTILESMAWGFPVVCTPQSGYYETAYMRNIYHEDLDRSVQILRDLQWAETEVLLDMAEQARDVVRRCYTWDAVVSRICEGLGLGKPASGQG